MQATLANILLFDPPWGKVLLVVHLLVAVFALGAVTHHLWELQWRATRPVLLRRYARWAAIGYAASWVIGSLIYPSYNLVVRAAPEVGLNAAAKWAVGTFEYKEHFGTFALLMLPWILLSARRFEQLSAFERRSYYAAAWTLGLFAYYVFISGAVVTAVRGLQ